MSYSGCFEVTINAEGKRRIVPVRLGSVEIGRSSENTIRLDDRNISRHHARLSRRGRKIWVEDLTSVNGSYVNGEKICRRTRVFCNDVIRLGDVELELQGEGMPHRDDETTDRSAPLEFVALQEPQPCTKTWIVERTLIVAPPDDADSEAATDQISRRSDLLPSHLDDTDPTAVPKPPSTPVTAGVDVASNVAAPSALLTQATTEPQIVYRRRSGRRAMLVILAATIIGSLLVAGAGMLHENRPAPAVPTVTEAGPEAAILERAKTASRRDRWLEATRLAKEVLTIDPSNAAALTLLIDGTDAIRSDDTLTAALAAKAHGDWRLCWRIVNGIPPEQRTGTHNELIGEVWHGLRITLLREAMQSLQSGELTKTEKTLAELDALGIAGGEVNRITELLQLERRVRRQRAERRGRRRAELQ